MTTQIATSPAETYGTMGTQSEARNDGMTGTQSAQRLWDAVLARDARSDGRFVYAVRSTGVYCRPSCPSRRPNRDSVRFFPGPDAAEVAGFRECRRCHPRVVRLNRARRHDRCCALALRVADQELELARLVASKRQPGAVIPLQVNLRSAKMAGKPWQQLERCRQMRKPDPWNI